MIFADDTELHRTFHPDPTSALTTVCAVKNCFQDVKAWMTVNKLMVNDEKTEAISCSSKASQLKVSMDSVHIGQSVIPLSDTVRDLGFFLDKNLLTIDHISSAVRSCFLHPRCLLKLHQYLNRKTADAIFITCPVKVGLLQQCLWGMPANKLLRLQRVQNTAARIVTHSNKEVRSHHSYSP